MMKSMPCIFKKCRKSDILVYVSLLEKQKCYWILLQYTVVMHMCYYLFMRMSSVLVLRSHVLRSAYIVVKIVG